MSRLAREGPGQSFEANEAEVRRRYEQSGAKRSWAEGRAPVRAAWRGNRGDGLA